MFYCNTPVPRLVHVGETFDRFGERVGLVKRGLDLNIYPAPRVPGYVTDVGGDEGDRFPKRAENIFELK